MGYRPLGHKEGDTSESTHPQPGLLCARLRVGFRTQLQPEKAARVQHERCTLQAWSCEDVLRGKGFLLLLPCLLA